MNSKWLFDFNTPLGVLLFLPLAYKASGTCAAVRAADGLRPSKLLPKQIRTYTTWQNNQTLPAKILNRRNAKNFVLRTTYIIAYMYFEFKIETDRHVHTARFHCHVVFCQHANSLNCEDQHQARYPTISQTYTL